MRRFPDNPSHGPPLNRGRSSALTHDLLRRFVRWRAARAGIGTAALERFEEYLSIRYGQGAPPYVNPLQRPASFFPGLQSLPWHDPGRFDWVPRLESATPSILEEAVRLGRDESYSSHQLPLADRGRWSTFYLSVLGHRLDGNCERCPETAALVDGIEATRAAGLVYFSRLTPVAHIAPHCGPTNARLRCHLGLEVPPGARLRVGAEQRAWQEGRCLVFDDSFEHEVWNDADRPRLVLILDVWHPDLSDAERWALTEVRRFSPGARRYSRRVRRSAR